MKKIKRLTVDLSVEDHNKLKSIVCEQGTNFKNFINILIKEVIDRNKDKK